MIAQAFLMLAPALTLVCLPVDAVPHGFGRPEAQAHSAYLMYVGTYTGGKTQSKGIYVYRYESGHVKALGLAAETTNPSFLAVSPGHRFLYAVNETEKYQGQESGAVSAFAINHETGKLTFLDQRATGGTDPCFVSLDRTGKYVLVANYSSGSVAVFSLLANGELAERSAFVQHHGSSVNPDRQKGPHAHMILTAPDNRFALVSDLGLDKVMVYRFDAAHGSLTPNEPAFVSIHPGSGPRHFVFDPSGHYVYLISEIESTITVLSYDPARGVLRAIQTVSTLPKDFKGQNAAAEITLDASGRFLYASNRGDNSIAVFAADPVKHTLSRVERVSSGGNFPRHFALDPSGHFLLAANRLSNNIAAFRVDPRDGRLTPTGESLSVPAPVCIVFVPTQ